MAKRKRLRVIAGGGGSTDRSGGGAADPTKVDSLVQRVREAKRAVERLTPRQRQILLGITRGGSNKDIAGALGISPRIVEIHRRGMMSRLGAKVTADVVRIGVYAATELGEETRGAG